MKYVLKDESVVDEFIGELNQIEGVSVRFIDGDSDGVGVCVSLKVNALVDEIDRIKVLIGEQGEYGLALERLDCLSRVLSDVDDGLIGLIR